jgi:hypothetical protein
MGSLDDALDDLGIPDPAPDGMFLYDEDGRYFTEFLDQVTSEAITKELNEQQFEALRKVFPVMASPGGRAGRRG